MRLMIITTKQVMYIFLKENIEGSELPINVWKLQPIKQKQQAEDRKI